MDAFSTHLDQHEWQDQRHISHKPFGFSKKLMSVFMLIVCCIILVSSKLYSCKRYEIWRHKVYYCKCLNTASDVRYFYSWSAVLLPCHHLLCYGLICSYAAQCSHFQMQSYHCNIWDLIKLNASIPWRDLCIDIVF